MWRRREMGKVSNTLYADEQHCLIINARNNFLCTGIMAILGWKMCLCLFKCTFRCLLCGLDKPRLRHMRFRTHMRVFI